MADKKISQLTGASTPLTGTEVLPVVQSSATVKVSVDNLTVGRDVTTRILTASYTTTTEGEGVNINNPYVTGGGGGGYGSGANFYSYRSDTAAMVKAAQIQTVGRANWDSAANTSSALAFKVVNANTLTESMRIDYTGDIKFNVGNLVQGTAAKGINFSANTGAAGMTSQLLNWYEEGTWTPTRNGFTEVLGGGTITSTGTYTRVGRMVFVTVNISPAGGATIAATSGIGSYISGLPYTPSVASTGVWVNAGSVTASGSVWVNTDSNMYLTEGWGTSSALFVFSATYTV